MKTKEEFVTWLKSLPEDTNFCESLRCFTCPIAKFINECTSIIQYDGWERNFMNEYDRNQKTTLPQALNTAKKLWPKLFNL